MKNKYGFVAILLAVILLAGMGLTELYVSTEQGEAANDITIVTSFYPMYIAALNVVGDCENVTLENLSEPQTGCLHDYQLTPADMKLLSTADVFIVNGGGIESFLSDVAAQYPNLTIVNASENVPLIEEEEGHTHDHESEDAHAEEHEHDDTEEAEVHAEEHAEEEAAYNAHAWMSVEDYMIQIQTIGDALSEADESNAAVYAGNVDTYLEKLTKLQGEVDELVDETAGENIIIFHEAYDYVAEQLGMNVVYSMDLDEERQVSAGEVADVIHEIGENGVHTILAEELYGSDMSNTVMAEADVQVVYLDTLVRGDYDADSYIEAMESNIHLIKEAFSNEEDN